MNCEKFPVYGIHHSDKMVKTFQLMDDFAVILSVSSIEVAVQATDFHMPCRKQFLLTGQEFLIRQSHSRFPSVHTDMNPDVASKFIAKSFQISKLAHTVYGKDSNLKDLFPLCKLRLNLIRLGRA